MANQIKLSPKIIAFLSLLTILVPFTAMAGKAQAAETLSVGGKALNTNNGFRRFDGEPRMSIFSLNNNDPDQQFERLSGNLGGTLLKHRTTGKCLNAHYLANGSEINVWGCNGSDPDQNWNMIHLGGGVNLIQRRGTNLCVDSPTRNDTGKVHLWTCDANNANQRWISNQIDSRATNPSTSGTNSSTSGTNSSTSGTNPSISRQITRSQISNEKFEVVLAAIRPGRPFVDAAGEYGHAWVILVRRWDTDLVTYINNIEVRRVRQKSGESKYSTISALGERKSVPMSNSPEELKWSAWWMQTGESRIKKSGKEVGGSGRKGAGYLLSPTRLLSYRKHNIVRNNYYKYLPKNDGGQGSTAGLCKEYELFPDRNPETCNCSTFAMRIYRDITESKEFNNITVLDQTAPLLIAREIDRLHGWQDWFR